MCVCKWCWRQITASISKSSSGDWLGWSCQVSTQSSERMKCCSMHCCCFMHCNNQNAPTCKPPRIPARLCMRWTGQVPQSEANPSSILYKSPQPPIGNWPRKLLPHSFPLHHNCATSQQAFPRFVFSKTVSGVLHASSSHPFSLGGNFNLHSRFVPRVFMLDPGPYPPAAVRMHGAAWGGASEAAARSNPVPTSLLLKDNQYTKCSTTG